VLETKVISLGKRAENEEKPFFEQLLQEGARKLLQAAIENEVKGISTGDFSEALAAIQR
jgi:hypothetical protein